MTDPTHALGSIEPVLAKWAGEPNVLYVGDEVEVLMSDPQGRLCRDGIAEVPARTACWIRYWPTKRDYPVYRSCDLADLELSDEDFERLSTVGILSPEFIERVRAMEAENERRAFLAGWMRFDTASEPDIQRGYTEFDAWWPDAKLADAADNVPLDRENGE